VAEQLLLAGETLKMFECASRPLVFSYLNIFSMLVFVGDAYL